MNQLLVFRLGEEFYGLEVNHIQEVMETTALHYIPRAPQHLLGAVNFHGRVLPVFDLPAHLGFTQGERDHRVIVLNPKVSSVALATSQVRGFIPLDTDALLPVTPERREGTFIRSVLNREEEMINLLDLSGLLTSIDSLFAGTGGNHGG